MNYEDFLKQKDYVLESNGEVIVKQRQKLKLLCGLILKKD